MAKRHKQNQSVLLKHRQRQSLLLKYRQRAIIWGKLHNNFSANGRRPESDQRTMERFVMGQQTTRVERGEGRAEERGEIKNTFHKQSKKPNTRESICHNIKPGAAKPPLFPPTEYKTPATDLGPQVWVDDHQPPPTAQYHFPWVRFRVNRMTNLEQDKKLYKPFFKTVFGTKNEQALSCFFFFFS